MSLSPELKVMLSVAKAKYGVGDEPHDDRRDTCGQFFEDFGELQNGVPSATACLAQLGLQKATKHELRDILEMLIATEA